MDALRKHDIEASRSASPSEKLAQALELMATGIRLKRASFEKALPAAGSEEIDRAVEKWLLSDA